MKPGDVFTISGVYYEYRRPWWRMMMDRILQRPPRPKKLKRFIVQ